MTWRTRHGQAEPQIDFQAHGRGALRSKRIRYSGTGRFPGFGVRVYASGVKVYVVQSRTGGKSVRVTIGRHGVISADEARRRAARIINRIKAGEEPCPRAAAGEVGGRADGGRGRGPVYGGASRGSLQAGHAGIVPLGAIDKYILPAFGKLPLAAVEPERVIGTVRRIVHNVPYAANRTVAVLSRMYKMAEDLGHGSRGEQPVPAGGQAQGAQARAVPHGRRVPPPGTGAGRGRGRRRRVAARGGGDTAADADRVPKERDTDLALGGRGY